MERLKILVLEVSYLKTNVFALDRLKDMFWEAAFEKSSTKQLSAKIIEYQDILLS